jgi:hypothetical protein
MGKSFGYPPIPSPAGKGRGRGGELGFFKTPYISLYQKVEGNKREKERKERASDILQPEGLPKGWRKGTPTPE